MVSTPLSSRIAMGTGIFNQTRMLKRSFLYKFLDHFAGTHPRSLASSN